MNIKYDTFIEIEGDIYFWSSEMHRTGRKLNDNEVKFLQLVWVNGKFTMEEIQKVFDDMSKEDATEEGWNTIFKAITNYKEEN